MMLNWLQLLQPLLLLLPLLPLLACLLSSSTSFLERSVKWIQSIYFLGRNKQHDPSTITSPLYRESDLTYLSSAEGAGLLFWGLAARDCLTLYMLHTLIQEMQELQEMRESSFTIYMSNKYASACMHEHVCMSMYA